MKTLAGWDFDDWLTNGEDDMSVFVIPAEDAVVQPEQQAFDQGVLEQSLCVSWALCGAGFCICL